MANNNFKQSAGAQSDKAPPNPPRPLPSSLSCPLPPPSQQWGGRIGSSPPIPPPLPTPPLPPPSRCAHAQWGCPQMAPDKHNFAQFVKELGESSGL